MHNKDFHISNLTLAIFKNIVFVCIVFILSMMKILYILKYLKYQMSDIRAIAFNILCQDTLGMQGGWQQRGRNPLR